jgi:hypothetical protein
MAGSPALIVTLERLRVYVTGVEGTKPALGIYPGEWQAIISLATKTPPSLLPVSRTMPPSSDRRKYFGASFSQD